MLRFFRCFFFNSKSSLYDRQRFGWVLIVPGGGRTTAVLSVLPTWIIEYGVLSGCCPCHFVLNAKYILPQFNPEETHFTPILTLERGSKKEKKKRTVSQLSALRSR